MSYIRNFCPGSFDDFCFLPSIGNSGGILVAWKSSSFTGTVLFQNQFSIFVEFISALNNDTWVLTSVYGPCDPEGKLIFLDWLENIQLPDDVDWLLLGDFNLIRRFENRNRPSGNVMEMLRFNNALSAIGVVEIPLQGKKFTWTNKQTPPLLERIDWFFTSQCWTGNYPNTTAHSLVMEVSDHWPLVVDIQTSIPKSKVFRFENCWLLHESFLPLVSQVWNGIYPQTDPAKLITAKFKALRGALRVWQSKLSKLKDTISNIKAVLSFIDLIEEWRDLSIEEWNCREILNDKLSQLLHQQKIYWK